MNTFIYVFLWMVFFSWGAAVSLFSEPLIRIKNVDAGSQFPIIKLQISISNTEKIDISEIGEDDLAVFEDGYRVNAFKLSQIKDAEEYLYLVFSLDSSKSISRKYLSTIKSIAADFIDNAHENDKIAIYRFNGDVERLASFGAKKSQLISTVKNIESRGKYTLLYNSIYDSLDLLSEVKNGKRAVIVFTDGKDEGSSITENDIIKFSRSERIPIYFICPDKAANAQRLARISKLTSGKTIMVREDSRPKGIYRKISFPGRNKFLLEYRSLQTADGGNHKIEVRLKHGDIREKERVTVSFDKGYLSFGALGDRNTVLLFIIVILLVGILILLIIFILKYRQEPATSAVSVNTPGLPLSFHQEDEEEPVLPYSKVLSAQDPEYSYTDAWVIEKNGPQTGKKFPLFWEETTIGRGKENSIIIDDEGISHKHSKIKRIKSSYQLLDLASDNGTFLNGKKLLRPKMLYDWDEIKIGRTILIFRGLKKPQ